MSITPSAFDSVDLVGQQLTDTLTAYTETVLDVRGRTQTVAYIIGMATQNGRWSVFAANDSSFAAEVTVQAEATVVAGAVGSFTATPSFAYYRVKLRTAVAGVQGSATIHGLAK